jgi:hypothetical protein
MSRKRGQGQGGSLARASLRRRLPDRLVEARVRLALMLLLESWALQVCSSGAIHELPGSLPNRANRQSGKAMNVTRSPTPALGDTVTRLDRDEPTLNENAPGDPRDTTSPRAMVTLMRRLLCGDTLSATSRGACCDGCAAARRASKDRLRAGLPADWTVGDKMRIAAVVAYGLAQTVSHPLS